MEDEVWKVVVLVLVRAGGRGGESIAQQIVGGLADHYKDFGFATY